MHFRLPASSIVALGLLGGAEAANLRSNGRKLTKSSECVVQVAELLEIEPGTIDSTVFECEMDSSDMDGFTGLTRKIAGNASQMAAFNRMHKSGQIVAGETVLTMGAGTAFDDSNLFIPHGLDVSNSVHQDSSRRRLAIVTGDKPILVVRVTDGAGLVRAEDALSMSYDIFGGGEGDVVNLKSQMFDCSFGQLNIVPGAIDPQFQAKRDTTPAPGMIEVSIGLRLDSNDRYAIRNAVTSAVQTKLGHGLPGPYQQVMYVLHSCAFTDCGWAAYAYINSWNSVYQSGYYKQVGVQMHELGHNFNLAHSGGLNGQTYTDHTGLMGNPLYSDEVGKMCWNAAKTWQIGWYNSNRRLINPSGGFSEAIDLVGIADFQNNPGGLNVVLKIETGAVNDYFIAFNRAIGVNSQNDEADDEVTIVQVNGGDGNGYSQSFLRATLIQGETYSFTANGETVTVTASEINLASNPAVATVCVSTTGTCGSSSPTKSPTPQPTKMPVPPTPLPTTAPSTSPTPAPTKSPVPPTREPTTAPSTSPTLKPTSPPTRSPVEAPCGSFTKANECPARCTWYQQGSTKECREGGSGPGPEPTPSPPTSSPPGPGGCTPAGDPCSSGNCSDCCDGSINQQGNKFCT